MTTIMIVDDHPLVRDGMSAMLENESDFSIVASVANGEAAVEHCRRAGFPDVTVMDIRMPGLDGFATLERMKRFKPDVAVLLLADMPLKAEEEKARQLGARGYLPKSMDWERLVAAIRHAAAADIDFLMEGYDDEKIGPLSAREKEILGYLALGKTHEEIAIIGGISPETVRSHVKGIFRKLDCPNAAAAVGRAYELGILRA